MITSKQTGIFIISSVWEIHNSQAAKYPVLTIKSPKKEITNKFNLLQPINIKK
jgi:hypothetical protein